MNPKLSRLFKNIPEIEPSPKLETAILKRIGWIETHQRQRRLVFSYFGLAFSGLAVIWTLVIFGHAVLNSEFWSVLSLVFSDARTVIAYFPDFVSSLLETLPATSIIAILVPIFILFIFSGLYFDSRNNRNNYLTN
jgi:hypothetical protein